ALPISCADPVRSPVLEQLLRQTLANNGGLVFLQKLALLGAVYGQVDVLVKFCPEQAGDAPTDACPTQLLGTQTDSPLADAPPRSTPGLPHAGPAPAADATPADAAGDDLSPQPGATIPSPETITRLARMVRFEIVDPTRALPLLEPEDCRCVEAFATVYQLDRITPPPAARPKWWQSPFSRSSNTDKDKRTIIELVTPTAWQKYDDYRLVDSGPSTLGRLPLVHVQNTADPLSYDGVSDVEPLIPLQDELNTRLSDRAYRIAMQSFKMYLGKHIENFVDLPVTPGRMWSTDNADADVIEFGGDSACPSEESHIAEVREALDKLSGVSPVAAGAIRGKIGNLTSAEALRVTMMALLSRTERKRTTYGTAIAQLCELTLAWLDHAGLLATLADERGIQIHWPNPMPSNESEQLALAKAKESLGIPREIVLRELGYAAALVPSLGTPGEG
ncbi:MAG: Phage portal protein Gp6-like, partial [Phycisphaerales bacterium]|nr:Phage portal protein Gp6-like [Phycisphaerales bacterium]